MYSPTFKGNINIKKCIKNEWNTQEMKKIVEWIFLHLQFTTKDKVFVYWKALKASIESCKCKLILIIIKMLLKTFVLNKLIFKIVY